MNEQQSEEKEGRHHKIIDYIVITAMIILYLLGFWITMGDHGDSRKTRKMQEESINNTESTESGAPIQ